MNARLNGRIVGALLMLLAVCAGTARAGGQQSQTEGRFLTREEIRLYGLNLTVAPPEQVVPKDIATIVSTFLQAPTPPGQTVSPFSPDAEVRATLRGPSLAAPIELAVKPGNPFNIPALKVAGVHTLDNIRLVSNGEVLLRGNPESARIEVIDKLLVSQVTARALTADEIRERGIVFDRENFQAYNFSAAFAIQDTPITINFPVLLPRLSGPDVADPTGQGIPGVPTPAIPQLTTLIPDTLKLQTKLPNLQVVGFSLKMPAMANGELIVPPIPGIIAIPGDIGFLNQYFSVMLMVGNVAPASSNLVVSQLSAEILLPPGKDNVPLTPDDPLRMAMTARGESPRLQVIAQAGPDGKLGTADDIATIGPGESGNAEYLVEGRREGSHIVEMRIKGTLNGLPVGPVEVTGTAMGAVLVRNPTFTLTFTHPEVVTAGEPYTLDVTVTNTSASPANFVSLNLNAHDIGGATLVGQASQAIDSIAPGDSSIVSFDLVAKVTGKVFAATLDADDGVTGRFGLKTSVGELGVPLSPDSLVLPQEANGLPKPLRDAAIGLLGKAWAVATAPPAAVPADLLRFSRKIVLDRAVEVAEAGLRVTLQEPLRDSATQLAVDFLGSNFPRLPQRNPDPELLAFEQANFKGFDLLRRRSIRGDVFADAIATLLRDDLTTLGASAFHRDLASKISYRPAVLSVLASAQGALPVRFALVDGANRRVGGDDEGSKVIKEIPFSDLLRFKDGGGLLTSELALVGAPEAGLFTVRLARAPGVPENASFSLSLIVPGEGDSLRQIAFDNLTVGQRPVIAIAQNAPYRLAIEWVGVATTGDVQATADAPIVDPAPSIVSVIQRAPADRITCEADDLDGPQVGRIVAVLFSEEVTPASVQDKAKLEAITNYAIDGNAVVGVALQPGRRIAYLALRDPFGPLVPRSLTVSNVSDPRGNVIGAQAMPMVATVTSPAGVVSGQVLRADGTPAAFANVRLFYRSPCETERVTWIGISSKTADAQGRYSWDYVLNGLQTRIVAIDAETGDVRDVRFQTRANGQRLNANIVFLGRGTVTGRTLGPDGRTPLKDTFVRVTSLTDQSQYSARTDAAGRFTIARVPVGSIVLDAVNTTAVAKTTESDYIPFAGATTTRDLILMDASSEPITIKRGNVSGFVLEANGQTPAVGVPVIAYYQANSQPGIPCPGQYPPPECAVAVTTSAAGGAYAFPNVVAGSLRLQTFNQSSFEQGSVGVMLAEHQSLTANILLAGGLGTVRGIVLDPAGKPVAGASVGGGLSLTTTDAQGRFVLTDVPVGRREIVAASQEVGSLASATVDLLYGGHEVQVTIVLDVMGSVSGVVTRPNGAVAPGIQVYVFKREGQDVRVAGSAVTNEQGGYRIDKVPAGAFEVSAFTADFSDGNIVPAVVKFHKQVVRADIQFRGGGGRVTGRVFADDGATPLRARVSVSGEQVMVAGGVLGVEFRRVENFRIVDTNLTTGKYAMAGLFVGPFTLRAVGAFSPDPIAVEATMPAPGQEVEVNLRLQPTSQLTGTVFMPDGETPVGANVPVHFKSDSFKTICRETAGGESVCENIPQGIQGADAVTDATGRYLFPVLNAGTYTLTVEGPGGRAAVAKGSLPAGTQGRMDLRLLGRGELTVRVRAADATTPIAGARVEVSQVGAPIKKLTFQADNDGVVTFTGADAFSEGDVVVIATDLRNGATGRGRAKITSDGQQVSVDVYLSTASGVVFGRVVRPDGQTVVPNAEVVVTSGGAAVAFATTDDQGRYRELGIPLGAVRVEAFEAATARRGAAAGQIASNGTQLELNIVEEALGVVRGRVVAAVTLQPLKAWRVALVGRTPSGRDMPALVTTTGIDGGFSFPGTPLGQFTITATKPGEPGQGTAQGSIVREGELVDLPIVATIPRQAVGTFTGTVVDYTGAPVANARLDVFGPQGQTNAVTADTAGRFTFGPAPLGRYSFRAFRQGSSESGLSHGELSFDGQRAATSVVLNGLSTVRGVVTQNGSPVPNARVTLTGQPYVGCAAECVAFANGNGEFTFERVSARTFTIVASDPNNVLRGAVGDQLNPGETKTVTIALETTRRLSGRVLNAQGDPVSGVVGEITIGARTFFAETGTAGTFEFPALPLGAYTLSLRDATGPGMAARLGTIATDVTLGDVVLDEAPPRVSSVTPLPAAVAVARAQAIVLLFSEGIDRASINQQSVQLVGPGGPVLFDQPVYRAGDSEVVLQPSSPLQAETVYTLTVTGVRDRAGRPMAMPFSSSFTTVDVTPPTLADVSPASGANGVSAFTTIRLRYSEALAPTAFTGPAIQLLRNGTPVDGRVDIILGNTTVVFTPLLPLQEDTTYQVRAQAATDLSGNKQAQGLDYTFGTTDRTPPQVVALVAAGDGTVIENALTEVTAQVGAAQDVAYVDFYLNDQIAFTARSAPFRLPLRAVPALGAPGSSIKVSAFATDTSGNRSPAAATLLVPIEPDAPPAVTLLAPAAGASVPNGATLNIRARATDDLGVAQVGYRVTIGATVRTAARPVDPASPDTTQSFDFQVPANAAPGALVRIEPTALDSKGQAIVGPAVDVRVLDAAPPEIQITGLTSGARVRPGQLATVVVKADDAGLVRSMTFTASGAATFTQTRTIDPAQASVAASFSFNVPPSATAAETVTLTASATDVAGNRADAATVVLPVADLNPPSITLRTQNGRNEMVPGSPLVIIAEANDDLGVGRIELAGSGALTVAEGRTIEPPTASAQATFTILVPETVELGATLQLQARAIDAAQNVSAPTALTITAGATIGVTLPASTIVNAGSTQPVEVTLTAPAGPGGVRVDLSTADPAIATVSTPVQFAAGETTKSATITARAGGATALIASVQSVERARMTVTVQGGIVTGLVLDPDLAPVAGAPVTVTSGSTVRTTISGPDGEYTVQGLPGPDVEVRARHEASGLYGLSRGMMAENGFLALDVVLLDAGSIGGVVRRANGTAVGAGTQVTIVHTGAEQPQPPEQTVFTNELGAYEFPLVTVGPWRIDATDASGNHGRTTVTVAGGEQVARDVLFLGRGTVRGVVKTASGQTVAGAALTFQNTSVFGPSTVTRTSDANGAFEFTGAFVGTFSVSATRAATGEGGSVAGEIGSDQQVVEVEISLSPIGALQGTVRRPDNSTVPGAAVQAVTGTGGATRTHTATTDPDGRYAFEFLPTGPVAVTATVAATREQGVASGTIAAGQTATVTVALAPQGRLLATVKGVDDQPIAGASVTVRAESGTLSDTQTQQTGAAGTALFEHVLAGTIKVTASANNITTVVDTTLAAGETKPVTLTLQPASEISGTIFQPGGTLPAAGVTVSLQVPFGTVAYMFTEADGKYRFTNVRANTYDVLVAVGGRNRARARDVVIPVSGAVITRDLEMVGLGTVRGRVLNGSAGVANMRVDLASQHPEFPHGAQATTDAAGFYESTTMVLGPISVTAGTETQRGEASGTLARSDTPLTLDIVLTNNATTLPQSLFDANASHFDIQMNGGLGTSSSGFYNGFLLDIVSGGQAFRFNGAGIPTQENGGRELATRQSGLAGLNVTRKVFVPTAGYFGRWLEILSNPTAAPITVDVRVTTGVNNSADKVTSVIATSSGDAVLDVQSATPDRWVMVDDAMDADPFLTFSVPATAFVFDGADAATRATTATHTVTPTGPLANRSLVQYTWASVTVPAGESVALMHFGVRQLSRAGATASATRLAQMPPEALAGLNAEELPIIRNFAVPAGGNSTLGALPPLTGRVTGRLLAGDGTTPVPNTYVKLQGGSPFFGRTYTMNWTTADGTFTLQGAAAGASSVAISTGDTFTLTARHPETSVDAPPLTASFAEGSSVATPNLVFTNTGLVKGLLRRHTGTPLTSGTVTATFAGTGTPSRSIGATSEFVFTGLPAGPVTLKGTYVPSGAGSNGAVSGTATTTVTAGQTSTQDVLVDATGVLTGTVKTGAGAAAVNTLVEASRIGFARSVRTDSGGRYTFADLPTGAFTVRAQEPATLIWTSVTATAVQDVSTEVPEITLTGIGTLNVQVNYGSGQPVGSGVRVRILEPTRGATRDLLTNASGRVTFTAVTVPGYTLRAFHPQESSEEVSQTGTITAGETKSVTLTLPSLGTARVKVRHPDGTPADGYIVTLRGGLNGYSYTNAAGEVDFTGLPVNTEFTVRAHVGSFHRDVTGLRLTNDAEILPVDVTLPAIATLAVHVTRGTQPAPGVNVAVRHAFAEDFSSPVMVDAAGVATFQEIPEGLVKIRVTSDSGALLVESEAAIQLTDHGKTVAAMVDIGGALPRTLIDGNGFEFDIAPDGQTARGTVRYDNGQHQAYDGGLRLRLFAGGTELPFTGAPVAVEEANGRELVISEPTPVGGLNVTRKVFVPGTGYFARYLEVLQNPTSAPITVDVEVNSQLFSGWNTKTVDQVANRWIVTDDATDQFPWPITDQTLAHVFAGDGAALPNPQTQLPTQEDSRLIYRWNAVTVQPGQSVALMHFAVQQPKRAPAVASATRLAMLPPEALVDLSAQEIAAIGNFAVPEDGVGTVPPIAMVPAFTASGQIFTYDGVTPAAGRNRVTLRSGNPLYPVGTTVAFDAPSYTVTGIVADSYVIDVVNEPADPFHGWETPVQVTKTLEPGQTSATEAIVFRGTGSVTGQVRYGNGQLVTDGGLEFSLAPSMWVPVSALPNSTFSMPIVPVGEHMLSVTLGSRRGYATFEVRPDANTTVDLRLPSQATVRTQILGVNGAPVPRAFASISFNGNYRSGTANDQGVVTFDYVTEGTFYIYASEPGGSHYGQVEGVVAGGDEGGLVQATVRFKALATLRVTVTRNGQPVVGAYTYVEADGGAGHSGPTDEQGVMLAENMPDGPFSVRVQAPDSSIFIGHATGTIPPTADGQTIDVPIVVSTTSTAIKGTLYASDGQTPLRNFEVRLRISDGTRVLADDYNDYGSYDYTGLPLPESGTVRLRLEYWHAGEEQVVEADVAVTEGQISTKDFTLPIGGVVGHVRMWDGSSASPASVRVYFDGESSYYSSLDEEGRYGVFGVPVDEFSIRVSKGEFETWGEGVVPDATTLVTKDFVFGRVTGTVRYADGTPVPEPTVFVTQIVRENEETYYPEQSNADGTYDIRGLQLGAATVAAESLKLEGRQTTTIASGAADVRVDIQLEADGIVTGTLRDENDVPVAEAAVALSIAGLERESVTNESGQFRFEHVKLGGFMVQARVGSGGDLRFVSASGAVSQQAPAVDVPLKLSQQVALGGRVLDEDGTSVVADADVFVESRDHSGPLGFWSFATSANAAGLFTVPATPLGQVTVSAFRGVLGGSATAQVTPTGPATLDVQLGTLVKLSPAYVLESAGYRYDISCRGAIEHGGRLDGSWTETFGNAFTMDVDGAPFPCLRAAAFEDDRRELRLEGRLVSDLLVTRKVFVSPTGGFTRYLEVLTNPRTTAQTVSVSVGGELGNWSLRPSVIRWPSETANTYAVTRVSGLGTQAYVLAGANAPTPLAWSSFSTSPSFYYGWTVTVPPGETVILLHFAVQHGSSAMVTDAMARELSLLSRQGLLDGMSADERARVINFVIP